MAFRSEQQEEFYSSFVAWLKENYGPGPVWRVDYGDISKWINRSPWSRAQGYNHLSSLRLDGELTYADYHHVEIAT